MNYLRRAMPTATRWPAAGDGWVRWSGYVPPDVFWLLSYGRLTAGSFVVMFSADGRGWEIGPWSAVLWR